MNIELTKRVISDNIKVPYGIFGIIDSSGYFPTHILLNEFLMLGSDPCDQDGRMESWLPFDLSQAEYDVVLSWWLETHQKTVVSDLGVTGWSEWTFEILDLI